MQDGRSSLILRARPYGGQAAASMKKLAPLLVFLAAAVQPLAAQENPERVGLLDTALLGFGSPDPAFTATYFQPMDFTDGTGKLDMFETRLRVPLFKKRLDSGWRYGASLIHEYTMADFNGVLGLGSLDLQTLELQMSLSRFPRAGSGWMGLLIASPGVATDFDGFSSDDFAFRVIAVGGYQLSPRLTLALAGYFSHSLNEQRVLPGIGILWRPSNAWAVQLTPPIGAVVWRASESLAFNVSAFPSGGAWDVGEEQSGVGGVVISGYRVGLGAEYRLGSTWRLNVLAGMNVGGDIELRDSSNNIIREADLDAAAFGMVGVSCRF